MMTGGRQGGRVRYRAEVEAEAEAYFCHCGLCRKATGAASAAFVNMPVAALTWESAPDWYRSSPIAHRPFCPACGTPLGFAFIEGGDTIDIMLGFFDDPAGFVPRHNHAIESALPGWQDGSHLPGTRLADNPSVAQRWIEAVGKLPD